MRVAWRLLAAAALALSSLPLGATAVEATPVRIRDIQGSGHISPLVNTAVSDVSGIVTAVRPVGTRGFYMQDPAPDGDVGTSEAIFVFTGATAPAVSVGDLVRVSGRVLEFRPGGASSTNLTTTQLARSGTTALTVTVIGSGSPLPAATVVGEGGRLPPSSVIDDDATGSVETSGTFDAALDGIDFWESLEAMRVTIADAVAVGPTNRFGEIPVVPDDAAGLRTDRGGIVVRAGDFNPERVLLDDALAVMPMVDADTSLGDVTGVLDYSFGNFKLLPSTTPEAEGSGLDREVTDGPRDRELAVATFNVLNLDPGDGATKFAELAALIVDNLRSPDLLAIEEIQDNNGSVNDTVTDASVTAATLVSAIEAAGGPHYEYRDVAPQDDQDGGEPGGNIRVGFLFRTDRGLSFVDRPGAGATTATTVVITPAGPQLSHSPGRVDPTNAAFTQSRKPLAGEFRFHGKKLFVIANHFNSKTGDQPLLGRFQPPARPTEAQRHQQAAVVNGFVDQLLAADADANVIVLGDLNDFEFSQTLDIVKGGVLANLVETVPPDDRYTFLFDGNSQTLDHVLVSPNLGRFEIELDIVHVNAEFAVQASDHDPLVARIELVGRPKPKDR
jgi:predicted extracellular nuclease